MSTETDRPPDSTDGGNKSHESVSTVNWVSSDRTYASALGAASAKQRDNSKTSLGDHKAPGIAAEGTSPALPETAAADPASETQTLPEDGNRANLEKANSAGTESASVSTQVASSTLLQSEQRPTYSETVVLTDTCSSKDEWSTEKIERLSIAELLRVEPSSLEDYERLLVETKVAAAYAESERERLEHEVQSLQKRVHDLQVELAATREAYEALKQKSLRLSDELDVMQRRNHVLELRLRDLDGEWNRGHQASRRTLSKEAGP